MSTAATAAQPRRCLTNTERDVLALAAEGHGDVGIADALGISVNTVKSHKKRAFHSLGARNSTHAVVLALWTGELQLDGITRPQIEAHAHRLAGLVGRTARLTLISGAVVAAQVVAVDRAGVDVLVFALASPKRRYSHRDITHVEPLDTASTPLRRAVA